MAPLEHYIISHPGKRKHNEDCVFPAHVNGEGARTYIVCDGVGGHSQGELASAMVSRKIGEHLSSLDEVSFEDIHSAIAEAELLLSDYSKEFPESKGMATTIVGLHPLGKDEFMAYWVGDSRLYQIRNGKIVFKTKDHSLVQMMVDRGEMTEEEASQSSSSNIITQAINDSQKSATASIEVLNQVEHNDLFVLVSDGILEGCPERDLLVHLYENQDLKHGVAAIREQCEEHSNDNFSIIALRVNTL